MSELIDLLEKTIFRLHMVLVFGTSSLPTKDLKEKAILFPAGMRTGKFAYDIILSTTKMVCRSCRLQYPKEPMSCCDSVVICPVNWSLWHHGILIPLWNYLMTSQ